MRTLKRPPEEAKLLKWLSSGSSMVSTTKRFSKGLPPRTSDLAGEFIAVLADVGEGLQVAGDVLKGAGRLMDFGGEDLVV